MPYNKTALKKMKKDELVEKFLKIQESLGDSSIEELSEDYDNLLVIVGDKVKQIQDLKKEIGGLKEEKDTLKDYVEGLLKDNEKLVVNNCQLTTDKNHNKFSVELVKSDYETRYRNKIKNLERDIEYMTNHCAAHLLFQYKKLLEDNNINYHIESDSEDSE